MLGLWQALVGGGGTRPFCEKDATGPTLCGVLEGTGSQWVVSVYQHTLAGSLSKAFYRVAVEPGEAA